MVRKRTDEQTDTDDGYERTCEISVSQDGFSADLFNTCTNGIDQCQKEHAGHVARRRT